MLIVFLKLSWAIIFLVVTLSNHHLKKHEIFFILEPLIFLKLPSWFLKRGSSFEYYKFRSPNSTCIKLAFNSSTVMYFQSAFGWRKWSLIMSSSCKVRAGLPCSWRDNPNRVLSREYYHESLLITPTRMRFRLENSLYEQYWWNNRVGIEEADNGLAVIWKMRACEHAECRAGFREESQGPG